MAALKPLKRWRYRYSAWYYRVPKNARHLWDGKSEFRLGATLEEAWATWERRTADEPNNPAEFTFNILMDAYEKRVVDRKTFKSAESNLISISRLRKVFGKMRIVDVKTHHVAQYRDIVSVENGRYAANRDLEVISHAYTKAQEWGWTEHRPQCKKNRNPPRDRYIEDWEMAEALKVATPLLTAYIWLKLATGQRRKDLLSLTLEDIRPENPGIRFNPSKTSQSSGKKVLVTWTEDLLQWRDYALSIRPDSIHQNVFLNSRGEPWVKSNGTANGFDTLWRRFQEKALERTKLERRFQEKDMRAKTGSDVELEHASKLLAHTKEEITRMVYRRKGEVTQPHKTEFFDGKKAQ